MGKQKIMYKLYLNGCCIGDSEEYRGQFPRGVNGDIIGCDCLRCKYLRGEK